MNIARLVLITTTLFVLRPLALKGQSQKYTKVGVRNQYVSLDSFERKLYQNSSIEEYLKKKKKRTLNFRFINNFNDSISIHIDDIEVFNDFVKSDPISGKLVNFMHKLV